MLKRMVGCAFPHRGGRSASVGASNGVAPAQRSAGHSCGGDGRSPGDGRGPTAPAPAWAGAPPALERAAPQRASGSVPRPETRAELESRRVVERDFVKARDTDQTGIWYIIDADWLAEWKRFVSKGGPLPGPIRNDSLVDSRGRPRQGRVAVDHYRGVNREVWQFLEQRYGGGPHIRRRQLDLYAEPLDPPIPPSTVSQVPSVPSFGGPQHSTAPARDVKENPPGDKTGQVYFIHESDACVVEQPGDGNCLFHALSYSLDDGSDAASLRREISRYIASNPDLAVAGTALKDWVKYESGAGVEAYAAEVAGDTWGGAIEMEALARLKTVNVHVYEASLGGYSRICVFDAGPSARQTVSILYQGREHYDALMLSGVGGTWVPRKRVELPQTRGGG